MKNYNSNELRGFCLNIVNQNTGNFYVSKQKIKNNEIEMYNYAILDYKDFKKYNGYELRGLTFVKDNNSDNWKHYLHLNKFFNLNENEDVLFEKLKNRKIKGIYEKIDGSMITFIELNNGLIQPKTKMGFDSDIVKNVEKYILKEENERLLFFINKCLKENYMPIFEYVSPTNQIVIKYKEEKLVLLQIRDNINGRYLSREEIKQKIKDVNGDFQYIDNYVFEKKKYENEMSLKELIEMVDIKKEIEGWIVEFEDGFFIKVKTKWYSILHGTIDNNQKLRENLIIESIIREEIDDIKSNLVNDMERFKIIEDIIEKIKTYIHYIVEKTLELYNELDGEKYSGNVKDFALDNVQNEYFHYVMFYKKSNKDIEKLLKYVKENILKQTKSQKEAILFLEKIKY
jgi:RNA ligase